MNCLELPGVSYEGLLEQLDRYSPPGSERSLRERYPHASLALLRAALEAADECPVCASRFVVRCPDGHSAGCPVPSLLPPK